MDEVAIIGAGPVGLTLAILLTQRGCKATVYEKRTEQAVHSRAIGLHPPAQKILELAGVGARVQERGVQIRRGIGISAGRSIGTMDFAVIGGEYPYVLSLPQQITESILRERLEELAPGALVSGADFTTVVAQSPDKVEFNVGGTARHARWLVAADGVNSAVRASLGVPFTGRDLPDTYLMGDFPDTTQLPHTAALFMHAAGIVESFPLPGSLRRWVVRVDREVSGSSASGIVDAVCHRAGFVLEAASCTMHSRFTTANKQVASMVHGRVVLLGDAAHQISPIGGQGLSLGFSDALDLAGRLSSDSHLAGFSDTRLHAARKAGSRAQLNMMLGRPLPGWLIPARDVLVSRLAVNQRLHDGVARSFTMTTREIPGTKRSDWRSSSS
ncbi:FAD-dependent oxidoreductase [Glutamicibacter arilaitensis]|uniref:FAD-dependent oxidoreductase n=1 Tax=Glutamicibacter arilaitensis TaxID=256701 RepID=UPI00384EFB4B